MKKCSICQQKADMYTTAHKKEPFVDGRLYDCVCFTCYFVPKTLDQTYSKDGSVEKDIELPYSCANLCEPKEILQLGACDSLKQAKTCVDAVRVVCAKAKGAKMPQKRPKPSWNIS